MFHTLNKRMRDYLSRHEIRKKNNFRWRGGEISRIEGFSDAVFACAVTLLVVSLEVPKTFDPIRCDRSAQTGL